MNIIDRYRQIKPTGSWNWDDSDELNKKVFGIAAERIDLKGHTSTELKMQSIISQMAQKIGEAVIRAEIVGELIVEDGIEPTFEEYMKNIGTNLVWESITNAHIKCPYCDTVIHLSGGRSIELKDNDASRIFELGYDKNGVKSSEHCFEFKKYQFEIETKSDKFVLCNDIRQFIKTPDRFKQQSINSLGGTLKAIESFASDNVVAMYLGNSGLNISQDTSVDNTFHFTEHHSEDSNLDYKGHISCGLWWVMGADMNDVDFEKLSQEEHNNSIVIDVVPNSTYILEYDMSEETFDDDKFVPKEFKFYKKD